MTKQRMSPKRGSKNQKIRDPFAGIVKKTTEKFTLLVLWLKYGLLGVRPPTGAFQREEGPPGGSPSRSIWSSGLNSTEI